LLNQRTDPQEKKEDLAGRRRALLRVQKARRESLLKATAAPRLLVSAHRQGGADMTISNPKPHPLKKKLRALKIRQWQIALTLGVSRSQVSLWLNGTYKMPDTVAARIDRLILRYEQAPLEEAAVA